MYFFSFSELCKILDYRRWKQEFEEINEILKEVPYAAMQLCERKNKNQIALMVYNQETEEIYTRLMQQIDVEKGVDKIKEILKKI